MRRYGSVLPLNTVALRQELEEKYVVQQQWKGTIVERGDKGITHASSSSKHGGNHLEKKNKQNQKRERLRNSRTLASVLA